MREFLVRHLPFLLTATPHGPFGADHPAVAKPLAYLVWRAAGPFRHFLDGVPILDGLEGKQIVQPAQDDNLGSLYLGQSCLKLCLQSCPNC